MRIVTPTFLTLLLGTTRLWASPQITFAPAPARVQAYDFAEVTVNVVEKSMKPPAAPKD